jgi:hypothetical protein
VSATNFKKWSKAKTPKSSAVFISPAQGNALGLGPPIAVALKGRNKQRSGHARICRYALSGQTSFFFVVPRGPTYRSVPALGYIVTALQAATDILPALASIPLSLFHACHSISTSENSCLLSRCCKLENFSQRPCLSSLVARSVSDGRHPAEHAASLTRRASRRDHDIRSWPPTSLSAYRWGSLKSKTNQAQAMAITAMNAVISAMQR